MKHDDLPERWKAKLQDYLLQKDREDKNLTAFDFPLNTVIHIKFDDESRAAFKYAFVIEAPELREVGLFSEHCGYHIFNSLGLEIHVEDNR